MKNEEWIKSVKSRWKIMEKYEKSRASLNSTETKPL